MFGTRLGEGLAISEGDQLSMLLALPREENLIFRNGSHLRQQECNTDDLLCDGEAATMLPQSTDKSLAHDGAILHWACVFPWHDVMVTLVLICKHF